MPRGRASGYDTQRAQILARAARLFAQQGYSGTSMNQVAEACGVSKPSLYHYVRDKHQLLVEIAETHVARLLALIEEVDAARLAPESRESTQPSSLRILRCRLTVDCGNCMTMHSSPTVSSVSSRSRRILLRVASARVPSRSRAAAARVIRLSG